MQTVYATHLELPGGSAGTEPENAIAVLTRWVDRRFRIEVSGEDGHDERHGTSVTWNVLADEGTRVFGLWVDQPDASGPAWRWRTYADVGVEDDTAWFRVRVALYGTRQGTVALPAVQIGRPGVVRDVINDFRIVVDDRRVADVMRVGADEADDLIAFLEHPGRRLPVVVVSQDDQRETFLDPAFALDRMLGLAHVAVVDKPAAWRLTSAFTKQLSCFGGAVRVYWPGFSRSDDRLRHRLYIGGALEFHGPTGLVHEITETLGRVAGLSIDEPPVRRELNLRRRELEIEKRIEARSAATARVNEAADSAKFVDAAEFAAFAVEYDQMERHLADIEQDAFVLEREIDIVRAERDSARAQVARLVESTGTQDHAARQIAALPQSVLSAVEIAMAEATYTEFLESALKSAEASEYGDPARVLDDLRLIEQVARDWDAGELATGPSDAFKERASHFRRGISNTASTTYASDYRITWNDKNVLMGPHLRRGVGSVAAILRIYMYFDMDSRRVVVGHVGRKLRDGTNKN